MAQTHLEEIAFSIIAAAGDGRAKVTEALKAARAGSYGQARGALKDADAQFLKAHQLQTDELLKKEADGTLKDPFNVLVAHAQDYVMKSSISMRRLQRSKYIQIGWCRVGVSHAAFFM